MRLRAFTKQRFPLWVLLALAFLATPLLAQRASLTAQAQAKAAAQHPLHSLWSEAIPAVGHGSLLVEDKPSRSPIFPASLHGPAPLASGNAKVLASLASVFGPEGAAFSRQRSWPLRC